LSGVRRRHHRSPTSAIEPAGQDPEARQSPGIECSTAPIAQKSQFFLDNVIAGLGQSWAFEPLTLNQRVAGSSPAAPTKFIQLNQHLILIASPGASYDFDRGNARGNE
jgi:hypothetical protein